MLLKSLYCLKNVAALFHHFFIQFVNIDRIIQKAHNTSTSKPLVLCLLQIFKTFALYFGSAGMGLYKSIIGKRSDKQWLRFKEGW